MLRNLLTLMIIIIDIPFYHTEYINNVGTVLFSKKEVCKKHWSTDAIGLLKARRYFQNLLPPPLFASSLNENYVDLLFNYFREAYSAIKRETDQPDTDSMMTTALSDAIGGYLKAWVLPVTKFAFYGGTISEQNVSTLYEFYDEIKRYLHTNGNGWHKPKSNPFDASIKTAVAKLPTIAEGDTDPCDYFVFFEKNPEGISVPIPHITWDGGSSKLFLPFKNHSIYAMNSTNSSSVLQKYYVTVKYCLQQRYPSMFKNFEARFQSWLAKEVLPHLGDDSVYLALGGVLALMNQSRELYANVQLMCDNTPRPFKSLHTLSFSKKTLIVTLLLVIEVVWCCIALVYTCYTKRKKKNEVSQVSFYVEPRRPEKQDKSYNTPEELRRKPFGIKLDISKPKEPAAVQTDVDTLFVREKRGGMKHECTSVVPDIMTCSVGILTRDSLNSTNNNDKIHNKKGLKINSSHSVSFSGLCRSSDTNPAVAIYSSKTIVNAAGTNRRLKHNNDKQIDKKVTEVKAVESKKNKKIHNVNETRKSRKDVPNPKRELKVTRIQKSLKNKVPEFSKSPMLHDIPRINLVPPSPEQSINTNKLLEPDNISYIIEHTPFPSNSSNNLNTNLSINNGLRNEGAVKAPADYVDTETFLKSISLLKKDSKPATETYAALTPVINFKIGKTETRIIEMPKYIEENKNANNTRSLVSENLSLHVIKPPKKHEISRNDNSRIQEMITYTSQQTFDKDCSDPKSKPSIKLEPKVSTPKRSMKFVPFVEDIIAGSSTATKKKKPTKPGTENKTTRPSIQKVLKDTKHHKKPHWEIVIDEPQKDVCVDITGTITMNSRSIKRSRIPQPSARTVAGGTEPRLTSNTPRVNRAGSLIPQLKKEAVDDLVLKARAQRNKLNTTI